MTESVSGKMVILLGLLHSGTTIVWKSFRKDAGFTCFDEPCVTPMDLQAGMNNYRGTTAEYALQLRRAPREFWRLFEPMHALQELDSDFTEKQKYWLRHLVREAGSSNIFIDETHLHLKIAALRGLFPNAHVIHLVRRPCSFVTSHLLPSLVPARGLAEFPRSGVRKMRNIARKQIFFRRMDQPPGMERETVIGNHPNSKFALLLGEAGYDVEQIMAAPSVVKLLAYWHYHYHYLDLHGPEIFGDRYRLVRYEDFATNPGREMAGVYDWLGMSLPSGVTYQDVHRPKLPFRSGDERWRQAARMAGFTEDEVETFL